MVAGNPIFCILALTAYLNLYERQSILKQKLNSGTVENKIEVIPPFLQTSCVDSLDEENPNEKFYRTHNVHSDVKALIEIWKNKSEPSLRKSLVRRLKKVYQSVLNLGKVDSKKFDDSKTFVYPNSKEPSNTPEYINYPENDIITPRNLGSKSLPPNAIPVDIDHKSHFVIGNFHDKINSNSPGTEMADSPPQNPVISFPTSPNLQRNNDFLDLPFYIPNTLPEDWINDPSFNPLDPRFLDPYGGNWEDDELGGKDSSGREVEFGAVFGKFWSQMAGVNNKISDGTYLHCPGYCEVRDKNEDCRLDLQCLQSVSFDSYFNFAK